MCGTKGKPLCFQAALWSCPLQRSQTNEHNSNCFFWLQQGERPDQRYSFEISRRVCARARNESGPCRVMGLASFGGGSPKTLPHCVVVLFCNISDLCILGGDLSKR